MPSSSQSGRSVRLNVKLAAKSGGRDRSDALAGTPGLKSVVQTFPDEDDKDLCQLYVVEVEDSAVEQALHSLEKNPAVEYAERPARRRLIR